MRTTETMVTDTVCAWPVPGASMRMVVVRVPWGIVDTLGVMLMVGELPQGPPASQRMSAPTATPAAGLTSSQLTDGVAIQERTPVPGLLTVMVCGETDCSGSTRICRLRVLTERAGEPRMAARRSGEGLGVLSRCPATPDAASGTAAGGRGVGVAATAGLGGRGTPSHDGRFPPPPPVCAGTGAREGRGVGMSMLVYG